jgi:hypothetical protein
LIARLSRGVSKLLTYDRRGRLMVFSIEECLGCHLKVKRSFNDGDYVFKEAGTCSRCGAQKIISMIYGESPKV